MLPDEGLKNMSFKVVSSCSEDSSASPNTSLGHTSLNYNNNYTIIITISTLQLSLVIFH